MSVSELHMEQQHEQQQQQQQQQQQRWKKSGQNAIDLLQRRTLR